LLSHRFEEREVLHVARADLQHVRITRHQHDVARIHHLRDDRQPGLLAGLLEDLESVFLEALERVG
jgi:hypothetical protein